MRNLKATLRTQMITYNERHETAILEVVADFLEDIICPRYYGGRIGLVDEENYLYLLSET